MSLDKKAWDEAFRKGLEVLRREAEEERLNSMGKDAPLTPEKPPERSSSSECFYDRYEKKEDHWTQTHCKHPETSEQVAKSPHIRNIVFMCDYVGVFLHYTRGGSKPDDLTQPILEGIRHQAPDCNLSFIVTSRGVSFNNPYFSSLMGRDTNITGVISWSDMEKMERSDHNMYFGYVFKRGRDACQAFLNGDSPLPDLWTSKRTLYVVLDDHLDDVKQIRMLLRTAFGALHIAHIIDDKRKFSEKMGDWMKNIEGALAQANERQITSPMYRPLNYNPKKRIYQGD